MIPPRVRARPDGDEAVPSLGIGDAAAGAGEVGIQRGGVLVDGVGIPTRRVRLPDLDQGVGDRPAALVEDTAGDDDALTLRLALVLSGEVVVEWPHAPLPEERTGDLRQLLRQQAERLAGCTQARRFVRGRQKRRMDTARYGIPRQLRLVRHGTSPGPRSSPQWSDASPATFGCTPAGRAAACARRDRGRRGGASGWSSWRRIPGLARRDRGMWRSRN